VEAQEGYNTAAKKEGRQGHTAALLSKASSFPPCPKTLGQRLSWEDLERERQT